MEPQEIKLKLKFRPVTLLAEISTDDNLEPYPEFIPQYIIDKCKTLLSCGGYRVCIPYCDIIKEDVALKSGDIIHHSGIIKRRGEIHQCHINSAKLWRKSPEKYHLVTGYSLDAGVWISHTWLLNSENKIVETTFPFDTYHGVILSTYEAEKFCRLVLKED